MATAELVRSGPALADEPLYTVGDLSQHLALPTWLVGHWLGERARQGPRGWGRMVEGEEPAHRVGSRRGGAVRAIITLVRGPVACRGHVLGRHTVGAALDRSLS